MGVKTEIKIKHYSQYLTSISDDIILCSSEGVVYNAKHIVIVRINDIGFCKPAE